MAEVDFSNARIEPYNGAGIAPSATRVNPTHFQYITLDNSN